MSKPRRSGHRWTKRRGASPARVSECRPSAPPFAACGEPCDDTRRAALEQTYHARSRQVAFTNTFYRTYQSSQSGKGYHERKRCDRESCTRCHGLPHPRRNNTTSQKTGASSSSATNVFVPEEAYSEARDDKSTETGSLKDATEDDESLFSEDHSLDSSSASSSTNTPVETPAESPVLFVASRFAIDSFLLAMKEGMGVGDPSSPTYLDDVVLHQQGKDEVD